MNEDNGNLVWEIVATFFISKKHYDVQYRNYERMVKSYARRKSISREKLALNVEEIAGLLDFKAIEELRNVYLRKVKDLSHRMFRAKDSTDLFDKYVSDIYHEVSILKEEHYTVKTYAPLYEEEAQLDLTERDKILDEVHAFFPRKTRQIHKLFQKAQKRLEKIIPDYGDQRVFVRSLYLFGEELLEGIYKGGLEEFYKKLYPAGGLLAGYLKVAQSFLDSDFYEHAQEALKKTRAALKSSQVSEEKKKEMREEIRQLAKRAEAALVH